jgi:abortive infection bacteriophage resistance protein
MPKIHYTKPYKKPKDLVLMLKQRGLLIADEREAERCIGIVGYYRLSAYLHPFLKNPKERHLFHNNVKFDDVVSLYDFDKEIRVFLFKAIYEIEIEIRISIANLGVEVLSDNFWFTNPAYFVVSTPRRQAYDLSVIKKEYDRSKEQFVKSFKSKYLETLPPSWIITEVLTFGTIATAFKSIKNIRLKKTIARRFNLEPSVFESWVSIIGLVRNLCCHHARVWNKWRSLNPVLPRHNVPAWLTNARVRCLYFDLCIIKHFLDVIAPNNNMADELKKLLNKYPKIYAPSMGFPNSWENETIWK